ncbi:hypothetical protein [Salinibacter ruber]|uniref:hypothetical protein n=1 Tax=Salinibacter ruber TaxID=146919 RepID=UPI002169D9D0|nr:hypothetical protein [Salinibacter ruber]MCS4098001.1 hypothetical protein [Salinibacter ruber]
MLRLDSYHRLAKQNLALLEVLGGVLVDTIADFQLVEHYRKKTEMIEHLRFWKISVTDLDRFDII